MLPGLKTERENKIGERLLLSLGFGEGRGRKQVMWNSKEKLPKERDRDRDREGVQELVAVAIDKDKGSQNALKWATENLLHKGQTVILVHVKLKSAVSLPSSRVISPIDSSNLNGLSGKDCDPATRELFLPFRCFCTRKDILCKDILIEDVDVAKGLSEYISQAAIETLVIGSSARGGFLRFKTTDIPGSVVKGAPDFCNIYVISRGKIHTVRSASRPAPLVSPLRNMLLNQASMKSDVPEPPVPLLQRNERPPLELTRRSHDNIEFRSPFTRKGYNGRMPGEMTAPDTDISFVSSGRPSVDQLFPAFFDNHDSGRISLHMSGGTDSDTHHSFESQFGRKSLDINFQPEFSPNPHEPDRSSTSSQSMEDVEAEMRRLKLELKQTMEMYSTACKEALTAKQKAVELQRWKSEEEQRLEEARLAEEAALAIAEQEKAKSKAAIEAAEAAKRIAELEAQKRINAELKAFKEAEEKKKALDALAQTDVRYRRYSIEEIETATEFFAESRKIGEGGYGPVYKGVLDHTPVAIKVLRPDAAQGRSQFQQEVEVLSCIRHPNMVLLLGACPEYGCLVYEFMANGSLDDRLFCRADSQPISWQIRFRIAAEIGIGLLFLHQTKPEPLVHRDLKPANILLDRNFVSKISDVGLARLVPPSVADTVTQYRMTSTAGTFCYIDPEYQQTGMLGVKSDIYSLGILFLQLITGRPAMGLTHHVGRAIEKGTFAEVLDPSVADWPVEQTLSFAKMSLKCAELRRKDRPDLGKVVMPELARLRVLAEARMFPTLTNGPGSPKSGSSQVSVQQAVSADPFSSQSGQSLRGFSDTASQ